MEKQIEDHRKDSIDDTMNNCIEKMGRTIDVLAEITKLIKGITEEIGRERK